MDAVPRQTSALAVVSLVSGILGWLPLPVIGSIVAIVTGHLARGEIRRDPGRLEGDGMALAGLILGYGALLLGIFAIFAVLVFFGGLAWLAAIAS